MPPFDSKHPPPPEAPAKDQRAFLNDLCAKNAKLIQELLDARTDVVDESKKDLAQRIRLILCAHVETTGKVPTPMRPFLKEVVRKEVANHKDRWRPDIKDGADATVVPSTEEDPEGTAELNEQRAKVDRYVVDLPPELADVIRCTYLLDMSLDQTAEALRRHRSTVYDQLKRAEKLLDELARDSERAAAERAYGPGRGSPPT